MAVFTTVSEEELAAFLDSYDLGPVRAFDPIEEGTENTNYRLGIGSGRYVLTLFERRTPEEALPFVVALLGHLKGAGQPVPKPVRNRDGEALGRLAGRPALIVTFLPGRSVADPDEARCATAGAALARMHCAAAGFPHRRPNPFGLGSWRRLLDACAKRADAETGDMFGALETALDRLERDWPCGLRSGPCHTDLFPDNVFFEGRKVSGLIDFYFSATEGLAYDLAVMLASWCFDTGNQFVPERAAALGEGYHRVRPLDEAERKALPLLGLGAAVRFTLTRAYDRLHPRRDALVREKDPKEFAARLADFERLIERGETIF